jgi:hypothetical protein
LLPVAIQTVESSIRSVICERPRTRPLMLVAVRAASNDGQPNASDTLSNEHERLRREPRRYDLLLQKPARTRR